LPGAPIGFCLVSRAFCDCGTRHNAIGVCGLSFGVLVIRRRRVMMSPYLAASVRGPLAPVAAGLSVELRDRGYSASRVRARLRLVLELSWWMAQRELGLAELNAGVIEELLAEARADPHGPGCRWFSPFSERDVLAYLRELGLVEALVVPEPTAIDVLVARFLGYLVRERGVANRTSVYWYERVTRAFLAGRVDPDSGMVGPLTTEEVSGFLLTECRHCSRWTGMRLVTSLRGLLRFLLVDGLVAEDLSDAVPRLPRWSLQPLPKALPAEQAARIVASCDPTMSAGRRDFAILMLLSRMGLRGCEIARLRLEDLDWRAGEMIVRGKRDTLERLPLPVDVGEALVDYLTHGRPAVAHRHVFLTAIRPFVPLKQEEYGIVGRIVARASDRAGIGHVGVHRLRHTVATEALAAGASLEEIASLLRHRDWVTTMGYAKVDSERLKELARPWPAGGRS
jgi:integrase/recombinase XerD